MKNNNVKYEVLEYPCELHAMFEREFELNTEMLDDIADQVFEYVWDQVSNQTRVQTLTLIREEMINDNIKY